MRRCCSWEDIWEWNLKRTGLSFGWFSVAYRTVATLAVAIILSESPEDDPIITPLLSFFLSYCIVSVAISFLMIVGISKEKGNYLLPYLCIHATEIFVGIILAIAATVVFVKLQTPEALSYFVPAAISALGVYAFVWGCILRLFHRFRNSPVADNGCQCFAFRWNCRRSESFKVAA